MFLLLLFHLSLYLRRWPLAHFPPLRGGIAEIRRLGPFNALEASCYYEISPPVDYPTLERLLGESGHWKQPIEAPQLPPKAFFFDLLLDLRSCYAVARSNSLLRTSTVEEYTHAVLEALEVPASAARAYEVTYALIENFAGNAPPGFQVQIHSPFGLDRSDSIGEDDDRIPGIILRSESEGFAFGLSSDPRYSKKIAYIGSAQGVQLLNQVEKLLEALAIGEGIQGPLHSKLFAKSLDEYLED